MANSGRSTYTTWGSIVPLVLEAVTIDHDETDARFDALSIRRSAFAPNCPPEWLSGVTRDEVAASVAALSGSADACGLSRREYRAARSLA